MSHVKRTLLQGHVDKGLAMTALHNWQTWRDRQTDPEDIAYADQHITRLERQIARKVPA